MTNTIKILRKETIQEKLPTKENPLKKEVARKYSAFCSYRHEIQNLLAHYKVGIYQ